MSLVKRMYEASLDSSALSPWPPLTWGCGCLALLDEPIPNVLIGHAALPVEQVGDDALTLSGVKPDASRLRLRSNAHR